MISIFAVPSYVGKSYSKHAPESSARRLSSRIRGDEIAEYLDTRLNPTSGYENDVRIYVKPKSLDIVRDGDWVDFLDSTGGFSALLKDRPKIKVIAASQCSYDCLKEYLTNEIVLIPSHHINQERIKRARKEVSVGGYIGSPSPVAFRMYDEIGTRLKEVGFEFVTCFNFKTKQDAIDLYRQIDLFIIGDWVGNDSPHKIPTKIINAASFGIPSIAYPLRGYKEIEGNYVQARNISELLVEVEKFKNRDYYNEWSNKVVAMAEKYHISVIAGLYQKLEGGRNGN